MGEIWSPWLVVIDGDEDEDEEDEDQDQDWLSPSELEGSREVRKSEEEVFSPAEDDEHQHFFKTFY